MTLRTVMVVTVLLCLTTLQCAAFVPGSYRRVVRPDARGDDCIGQCRRQHGGPLCAKKKRRRRNQGGAKGKTKAENGAKVSPSTEPEPVVEPESVDTSPPPSVRTNPVQKPDGPIQTKAPPPKVEEPVDDGLPGMQSVIPVPSFSEDKLKEQMRADLIGLKKKPKDYSDDDDEEEEANKKRISRKDKDAFLRLLEQQPYSDSDESLFVEEDYSIVNALLGERAKSFLGIPSGPLQVGHFIGALVIVLMAFVEYPGFPLTNLPTPLRAALQGGLGTVYLLNTVLAVLAVFKARERGQPTFLWVTKCLSVGGIAYDQLTQIPTLEQVEEARNRKGKRALKNRNS